ncbi:hypothetical protein [Oryza sativa Japonica Group]|uniref:Uncharacterized protein n=2 Tax=Oryza TaxID=4527 RepID=Q5VPB0_ORYSJ|nr:hypothetical protein [Oryza sativa Japonica Group]BAD68715.1 hypothetical protein [Oryza sativa Japonica Group]
MAANFSKSALNFVKLRERSVAGTKLLLDGCSQLMSNQQQPSEIAWPWAHGGFSRHVQPGADRARIK